VRPRGLLALGLALALGVFGLEVAVHSAHHLSAHGAAHCEVAAASAHVLAAGGGHPAVECPLLSVRESQVAADGVLMEVAPRGVNQGRAPPAAPFKPEPRFRTLKDR